MKIISYNVNGIRAAIRKGFLDWLQAAGPDVILLQETKANADQLDLEEIKATGYHPYFFSGERKGYSGVAIFSKKEPEHVEYGIGNEEFDREGRVIRADFDDISVFSVYVPKGTVGSPRLDFKMRFLSYFQNYLRELRKERPNLVIGGDFNICHTEIDIHDPVRLSVVSGFLPMEREWVSQFLEDGYLDSFRQFNSQPQHYSWWSYRANARANNKGWRLDYHLVTDELRDRLTRACILPEAKHSDHCPVLVEID